MPKLVNPFKYPLRSRKDMVEYIVYKSRAGNLCYQNRTYYPLAWNVKVNNVNLDFDNLYKIYRGIHGELNPTQLLAVKQAFEEEYGVDKYATTSKQESARSNLYDIAVDSARDSLSDDCTYRTTWDGTKYDIEWCFTGRSGGYASVSEYEGHDLSDMGNDARFEDWLNELEDEYEDKSPYVRDYAFIRKMYKFVVEMDALLDSKSADAAVEDAASYFIFFNEFNTLMEEYEDSKVLLHPV